MTVRPFTWTVTPDHGTAPLSVTAVVEGGGTSLVYVPERSGNQDVMQVNGLFIGPDNTPVFQLHQEFDVGGSGLDDLHFSLDWDQNEPQQGVPNLYTPDGEVVPGVPHEVTFNYPADLEFFQRVVDYTVPVGHYVPGTRLVIVTRVGPYNPDDWLVPPPPYGGGDLGPININRGASIWRSQTTVESVVGAFEVDWGDGSPRQRTAQRRLSHVYVAPGSYRTSCTFYDALTNDRGDTHTATVVIGVPSSDPLSAPFADPNAASGRAVDARLMFKPVMPR